MTPTTEGGKFDMIIEKVHLKPGKIPSDYVGGTKFEAKFLGELVRPDGSHYSRLERKSYYHPSEIRHPAKTPLHIARWSIQNFTNPGDWVLDPTAGVGTTLVEALRLGRNAFGVEIEFGEILKKNVEINNPFNMQYRIYFDDARNIDSYIRNHRFQLIVNNPPYSGDQRQGKISQKGRTGRWNTYQIRYDRSYPNLGLLNENEEYWKAMKEIYEKCIDRLNVGGHFIVGIKDMMRNKKPFLLPEKFGDLLLSLNMIYQGMVLLKHYPPTLHMNTYEKRWGVTPPKYQTILIFKKEKDL